MKKQILTLAALQSIAALSPEGFTIDKNTLQPITKGYSVAVADTQNSFGVSGAKKVIKYAKVFQGCKGELGATQENYKEKIQKIHEVRDQAARWWHLYGE